jgi:dipeptidyl aminopeptidase/acylaminoacyl peptidase
MKTIYVLLLLIVAFQFSGVSGQSISTQSFFQTDTLSAVKISPDGSRLAMSSNGETSDRLLVFRTDGNELIGQTSTSEGQVIKEFYWKGNDELLIATSRLQFGRSRALPTGELYAFHIPSLTGRAIAGAQAGEQASNNFAHILPSNPNQILVTRFEFSGRNARGPTRDTSQPIGASLTIPDITSRRSSVDIDNETRGPMNDGSLYADNQGVFRLAVANEEGRDAEVRFRNTADADWENISDQFSRTIPSQELTIEPVGFSVDNNSFYFLTHGATTTKVLMKYAAGTITTLLETEAFDINTEDLVYAINSSEVIGVRLAGDYTEPSYFSQHPDVATQQQLDAFFPGERVQVLNANTEGNLIVFRVDSPHRIGDFLLFNTEEENLSLLGRKNDNLEPEQMADVNAFAIRNPAGLILHGYATIPSGTEQPLPTIVIPNELPVGTRVLPQFNRQTQFLAHHGYAVLQINSRGSSGFGLNHRLAGDGEWGMGIIDDITLAVRWAVQNGIASEDKICLFGTSYGGFAAVASVIDQPERYQCAASYSGFYDLNSINSDRAPYLPGLNGRSTTQDSMDLGRAEQREQSPSNNTEAIQVPLLIAHGKEDILTPFSQAENFIEELENAEVTHEFLVKDGEGHKFLDLENRVEFFDKLLEFLDRNLK